MKGLRILIIEDHDLSRYFLEGFLKKLGYKVSSKPCGEDGLDRLEVEHFEVLLTDLHLPGMNGFEVIRKARALQPSIHVSLMTGDASQEVYSRVRSEEIDILFEKPLVLDRLMTFLDSIAFREIQQS